MGRQLRLALLLIVLALGLPLLATASGRVALAGVVRLSLRALAWLLQRQLLPGGVSPGLLLVLGGVLVMTAVGLVALFGSALEAPAPDPPKARSVHTRVRMEDAAPRDAYRGPRDLEFERGRAAGARAGAETLDHVLDRMVETEMGDPRIVRALPGFLKVNLYSCRGCGREGPSTQGVEGCAFECGFIETAFTRALGRTAIAHEVHCRTSGAPACEFEVWF